MNMICYIMYVSWVSYWGREIPVSIKMLIDSEAQINFIAQMRKTFVIITNPFIYLFFF